MKVSLLPAAFAATLVLLPGATTDTGNADVSNMVDAVTSATPVQPARRDTASTRKNKAKKQGRKAKPAKKNTQKH